MLNEDSSLSVDPPHRSHCCEPLRLHCSAEWDLVGTRLSSSAQRTIYGARATSTLQMNYMAPTLFATLSGGTELKGINGLKREVVAHRTALPDWSEKVDDIIAERDRVVIRQARSVHHRTCGSFLRPHSSDFRCSFNGRLPRLDDLYDTDENRHALSAKCRWAFRRSDVDTAPQTGPVQRIPNGQQHPSL